MFIHHTHLAGIVMIDSRAWLRQHSTSSKPNKSLLISQSFTRKTSWSYIDLSPSTLHTIVCTYLLIYWSTVASANGSVLKMAVPVAACIALAILLSVGTPAMADMEENCRTICYPTCDNFTFGVCGSLNWTLPILSNIGFFYTTCKVRVSIACSNVCTLNTLTPSGTAPMLAPGSTAAPPPCKAAIILPPHPTFKYHYYTMKIYLCNKVP
jgi:hypothetical protein